MDSFIFFFSLANNAYSIVTKVSQRSVRAQPVHTPDFRKGIGYDNTVSKSEVKIKKKKKQKKAGKFLSGTENMKF